MNKYHVQYIDKKNILQFAVVFATAYQDAAEHFRIGTGYKIEVVGIIYIQTT